MWGGDEHNLASLATAAFNVNQKDNRPNVSLQL